MFKVVRVRPAGHVLSYKYDSFVWINPQELRQLVGSKVKVSGNGCYLKISYQGKTLYRAAETAEYQGVEGGTIGLSSNSLSDLGLTNAPLEEAELEVRPAYALSYYLHHPDYIQRLSFRTTIVTLLLGTIFGLLI